FHRCELNINVLASNKLNTLTDDSSDLIGKIKGFLKGAFNCSRIKFDRLIFSCGNKCQYFPTFFNIFTASPIDFIVTIQGFIQISSAKQMSVLSSFEKTQ